MPTYESTCKVCEKTRELNRLVDDRDNPTVCECGEFMVRSFTAVPVQFKGTGFYKTGG